jgi:hypothetical protein
VTTGTALVLAKQGIRAALAARPGLVSTGAQITYAYPTSPTSKDIWLGNAESENKIAAMRPGTKKVDEQFDLKLFIQVLKTAQEGQEAADTEANVLFSQVQQYFAENAQIIPEIQWAMITSWTHSTGSYSGNESGHGSRFEIVITVKARLFP